MPRPLLSLSHFRDQDHYSYEAEFRNFVNGTDIGSPTQPDCWYLIFNGNFISLDCSAINKFSSLLLQFFFKTAIFKHLQSILSLQSDAHLDFESDFLLQLNKFLHLKQS